MSTSVANLDDWKASYYETMASTARCRSIVAKGTASIKVSYYIWSINRKMYRLIKKLKAREGFINNLSPEKLKELSIDMRQLHGAVLDFHELASTRGKGLLYHTLMSHSLEKIRLLNEEFSDYLEIYELSVNEDLSAETADAKAASERGENISLESLRHLLEV